MSVLRGFTVYLHQADVKNNSQSQANLLQEISDLLRCSKLGYLNAANTSIVTLFHLSGILTKVSLNKPSFFIEQTSLTRMMNRIEKNRN